MNAASEKQKICKIKRKKLNVKKLKWKSKILFLL